MIIIEGMDNTGKTKLSEYISEKFNLPLLKSPKNRTDLVEKAFIILTLNPNAVLDRFSVISEMMYGPILRGGTDFEYGGINQWSFYMDKLVRCEPLIFYCRPPNKKIFDFGTRAQMEGVIEHGEEILSAYDTFMLAWSRRLSIRRYDFTMLDALPFVDHAIGTHQRKRRVAHYEY